MHRWAYAITMPHEQRLYNSVCDRDPNFNKPAGQRLYEFAYATAQALQGSPNSRRIFWQIAALPGGVEPAKGSLRQSNHIFMVCLVVVFVKRGVRVASIGVIILSQCVKSVVKFAFERKETIMKKFVAWLLVCLMIVSSLPIAAFAEAETGLCPGQGKVHTVANCDEERLTDDKIDCVGGGDVGYKCTVCGDGFVVTVEPGLCEFSVVVEAEISADCGEEKNGRKAIKKCSKCDTFEYEAFGYESEEAAEDWLTIPWQHTWPEGYEGEGVDGDLYYGDRECTVCGFAQYVNNTAHPEYLAHAWSTVPELVKAPTCSANGEMKYTCTYAGCTATKTVVVEKSECEKLVYVAAVTPTCTEDGSVAYRECEVCKTKYELDADVVLDTVVDGKYNHISEHSNHYGVCEGDDAAYDWNKVEAEVAEGMCSKFERTCDLCGETLSKEVAHNIKSASNPNRIDVIDVPECHTTGLSKQECNICNEVIEFTTDAIGSHSWTPVGNFVMPTCTETGSAAIYCTVCGSESVPGYAESNLVKTSGDGEPVVYEATVKDAYGAGTVDLNGDGFITDADKYQGVYLVCDENGVIAKLGHNTFANGSNQVTVNKCVEGAYRTWTCNRFNTCTEACREDIAATNHATETVTIPGFCSGKAYTVEYCTNDHCEVYDIKTEWVDAADENTKYYLTKDYAGNTILGGNGVRLIKVTPGAIVAHSSFVFDWDAYTADPDAYIAKNFWCAPTTGDDALVITAPDCTEEGTYAFTCAWCFREVEGTIAAFEHDFENGQFTGNDEDIFLTGHTIKCNRPGCDGTTRVNHNWFKQNAGQPNETDTFIVQSCVAISDKLPAGEYTYKQCVDCEFISRRAVTPIDANKIYDTLQDAAAIHVNLILTDRAAFDCGVVGAYIVYDCKDCNKFVSVKVPATHSYQVTVENAVCGQEYACQNPTCTYSGVLKEHEWSALVELKLPTCGVNAAAGNIPYVSCTHENCSAIKYKNADGSEQLTSDINDVTIPALVHNVVEVDQNDGKYCNEYAYKHYACANCSEGEYVDSFVAAHHENSNGEKFNSLCDSDCVTDGDFDCVREFCTGIDGHAAGIKVNVADTCYQEGYVGEICPECNFATKTPVNDVELGQHIYGAYKTDVEGVYALTGDAEDFVVGASAIDTPADPANGIPAIYKQVCKFYNGIDCKATTSTDSTISYSLTASNKYGEDYNLAEGSIVALTLKVNSNGAEFASNFVVVNYDYEDLAFIGFENLSENFNTLATADAHSEYGVVLYTSTSTDATGAVVNTKVADSQELAVFYFRVVGDANPEDWFDFSYGYAEFEIVYAEVVNADPDSDVDYDFSRDFIYAEIEWDVTLDINDDGIVDLEDIVLALTCIKEGVYDARLDINKDGYVTAIDGQYLADYIVGTVDNWDIFAAGIPAVELASYNNYWTSI